MAARDLSPIHLADTAGLVIAPDPANLQLLDHVPAIEWQQYIRVAIAAGMIFVGAGRPYRADGNGVYMMVQALDALPDAIAMAHARMSEIGSKGTAWLVYATGDVERIARETLAGLMPTAGQA